MNNTVSTRKGLIKIQNKFGLHARAAIKLTTLASRYTTRISLTHNGRSIDAKDIMAVLALGAKKGTELELITEGEDYEEAFRAIEELFNACFDEE